MPKAVIKTSGRAAFLVEVDESVELPAGAALAPPAAAPADAPADAPNEAGSRGPGLPPGMAPVARREVQQGLSDLREFLSAFSSDVLDAVRSLANPDKVTVEFGVKFAGEAGVPMLTKASGEANITVSVEWERARPAGG